MYLVFLASGCIKVVYRGFIFLRVAFIAAQAEAACIYLKCYWYVNVICTYVFLGQLMRTIGFLDLQGISWKQFPQLLAFSKIDSDQ